MWRIWQIYHNELDLDAVLDLEPKRELSPFGTFSRPDLEYIFRGNYTPSEIVLHLCNLLGRKRCKNPIILSSDWAQYATPEDFCAIEFPIIETQLFTGYGTPEYTGEVNLPFSEFDGFEMARQYVVEHNSRFFSSTGSVLHFYEWARLAMSGSGKFDPYLTDYPTTPRQFSTDEITQSLESIRKSAERYYRHSAEDREEAALFAFFGRDKWALRTSEIEGSEFQFDDFYLSFEPKYFDIRDCYQYHPGESEFRFFRPINTDTFTNVYTIEDALAIAEFRNRGKEPLFWPHRNPGMLDFILDT